MNAIDKLFELDDRSFYRLFGSVALLVLVSALSLFLVPQLKNYQKIKRVHANLPVVPQHGKNFEQLLKQRDSDIAAKAKMLHGDMVNLPQREVEAFVIDRLQGIAWNHAVILEGVKPDRGESVDSFDEVLFRLEISGRYDDLFSWLHDVKEELGFVVIKEYEMSRATNTSLGPVLSVKLTIASYQKEAS